LILAMRDLHSFFTFFFLLKITVQYIGIFWCYAVCNLHTYCKLDSELHMGILRCQAQKNSRRISYVTNCNSNKKTSSFFLYFSLIIFLFNLFCFFLGFSLCTMWCSYSSMRFCSSSKSKQLISLTSHQSKNGM